MPHSDLWSATPGQPRGEAAARAALVCSKRSFRPTARARRPLAPRARRLPGPSPVVVSLVHTGHSTVCTSGQERRDTAGLVSDFAHAIRQRVHKRTRERPNRIPRVRKNTRVGVACAQADARTPESASTCPTLHTRGRPVCTIGQERRDTANLVSDYAHARAPRVRKRTRPVTIRHASVRLRTRPLRSCANAGIEAPGPTSARPEGCARRGRARPNVPPSSPSADASATRAATSAACTFGRPWRRPARGRRASWPARDGVAPCPPSGAFHK